MAYILESVIPSKVGQTGIRKTVQSYTALIVHGVSGDVAHRIEGARSARQAKRLAREWIQRAFMAEHQAELDAWDAQHAGLTPAEKHAALWAEIMAEA